MFKLLSLKVKAKKVSLAPKIFSKLGAYGSIDLLYYIFQI